MTNENLTKWKQELQEFRDKTAAFYEGTFDKGIYKGYSGRYGSYAQRSAKASMLRLRMNAGRLTKDKLRFIVEACQRENIQRVHFTTCESVQLHDISDADQLRRLMESAWDAGIVTMGGGGDYPRNVMCAPLSGVNRDGYFDVLPYAEAAAEYLMGFIDAEKMPRKFKVCFSDSPENAVHATYRDMGFVARPDGRFDVWIAGGMGNNPKFGVLAATGIEPVKILYYIKAMWLTFRAYGNYENRGRARTRYLQDTCGGTEGCKKAYLEKLDEVFASGEGLDVTVSETRISKKGDGTVCMSRRAVPQKQEGLYAVAWHPLGGNPSLRSLAALSELIADMEETELRIGPDETVYIINLTGAEAEQVITATPDSAETLFETSVSCIGSATCQVGLRDSQGLLHSCIEAVRAAGIADGALPQIAVSGCPSSCSAHQTAAIGFSGAAKKAGEEMRPAFLLHAGGCSRQSEETMGRQYGTIFTEEIPDFLVRLGKTVEASGTTFAEWFPAHAAEFEALAEEYTNR